MKRVTIVSLALTLSRFIGAQYLISEGVGGVSRRCAVLLTDRTDRGYMGIGKVECESKGNCWNPTPTTRSGVPWCFAPRDITPPYQITSLDRGENHLAATLEHCQTVQDPTAAPKLNLRVRYQTDIINVCIRAENSISVPDFLYQPLPGYPMPKSNWSIIPSHSLLQFKFKKDPFQFSIRRRDYPNAAPLFITAARHELDPQDSIIFKDHYVEVGTQLSSQHYIYGLGERATSFRKSPRRMAFHSRDTPANRDQNSYGSHPFYLEMRDGMAHGVLMLNCHPMEVELTKDALIYRMLGGEIDLYFFVGPTPDAVIEQYTRLIGRPPLYDPRVLGLHQCRYGYQSLDEWKQVIQGYEEAMLPLDGVWFDIDHMHNYDILTIDPIKYGEKATQKFVKREQQKGRMVIPIVDPGVSVKKNFLPYQKGIREDIFLRTKNKKELYEGFVWPGPVHFIDFFCRKSEEYWKDLILTFHKKLSFDGLWLDMNEPASLRTGHKEQVPVKPREAHEADDNYPPFLINNGDEEVELFFKTINMDVVHVDGTRHLTLHNAYGLAETLRTATVLEKGWPARRHFILSRSTFPGSGRFAAHWLGDNYSDFDNMRLSISGLLDFQLFGIPMVGADICGFLNSADEELCARWMALGAFYPFARNHNSKDLPSQEPYRWPLVAKVTRKFYALRYSLLPYWYTLLWMAHKTGKPVIRPLFFEFPLQPELYDIDEQFMVGSAIMVAPVLNRGADIVKLVFPLGIWYYLLDFTFNPVIGDRAHVAMVHADILSLPVFLRGGNIILMQTPALTIRQTRQNPHQLVVALDGNGQAEGLAYFDDGIASDPKEAYTLRRFKASCQLKSCKIEINGSIGHKISPPLTMITILNPKPFNGSFMAMNINQKIVQVDCKLTGHIMIIKDLSINLNSSTVLQISLTNNLIDAI